MEGHANITPPFLFLPPSLALLLASMLSGLQPPFCFLSYLREVFRWNVINKRWLFLELLPLLWPGWVLALDQIFVWGHFLLSFTCPLEVALPAVFTTNPAMRECGIRPIPSLSCPALELEMMGRSLRVMLCFPWVSRGPRPSRPLSAQKKVCSRRARKREGGNVRVLSVPLCYIMNEFGCNDLPLFKMSLGPLLIWLSQPQSCSGRVWNQTKQHHPSKSRGQMPLFLG